jgi:acetolactate synthase regulatory subunit
MIQTASPPTSPAELLLSVELQAGSECALLRALSLLHRRRCRVLEARYWSAAGADRLTLRVQAPPRHAHCVEMWLSSLIDVRAVAIGSGQACGLRSA